MYTKYLTIGYGYTIWIVKKCKRIYLHFSWLFLRSTREIREPDYSEEYTYRHEWYRDESECEDSVVIRACWEESALLAGKVYRELQHPADEVIVVVISCKEESCECEHARREMVAPDSLHESRDYDDIDREYEYPLPPAEYTDLQIEVELVDECETCREYRDRPDHGHIGEVGDIRESISYLTWEEKSESREDRTREYDEDSDREDERVERHFHKSVLDREKISYFLTFSSRKYIYIFWSSSSI